MEGFCSVKDTILVVEDEPDILDLVAYNLRQADYNVLPVNSGELALEKAEDNSFSAVVLDIMLPGIDGLEVCRKLKGMPEMRDIPIVMLTAKTEEVDRIVGLELGADDYLQKPFSPRELVLRIKAILRRYRNNADPNPETEFIRNGNLFIDTEGYRIEVDGQDVGLTAIESKLLFTLAQRRGRVQSRDELLRVVWGYEHSGYRRTVDTHIRRLREKLGSASSCVQTVRGIGYCFRRIEGN